MLTIQILNDLREIINLKALCRNADVSYYTVKNKTLRFRKNPNNGRLTKRQSLKIEKCLESKGLKFDENLNIP